MTTWKGIIAKSFTPDEFDQYLHTLKWDSWRPGFVVLHNTGVPSLKDRPNGLTIDHIKSLEVYYRNTQKWKAGPHLFIDDHQIWIFTSLTVSGTHSPSWNKVSWGVEMLGDYSIEPFGTGRGLLVQQNTIAALASLHAILGIDPGTLRLHKEDPLTTHACPGINVHKDAVIEQVQALIVSRHGGDH